MAARADHRGIGQLRHHGSRILDVLGERAVAGLAVDARVLARLLHGHLVAVAVFTGLVTGIVHWFGGKLGQRIAAIVAILSKALGNKVCPNQNEHQQHHREHYRQPDQMFGILEFSHAHPLQSVCHPHGRSECQSLLQHSAKRSVTYRTEPCDASPPWAFFYFSMQMVSSSGSLMRPSRSIAFSGGHVRGHSRFKPFGTPPCGCIPSKQPNNYAILGR